MPPSEGYSVEAPDNARPNEDPPVARRVCHEFGVEATTGFEPVNRGFADLRVEPLHHVARCGSRTTVRWMLAAPRGFEPRFTDPKSAVLPLDEGAAVRKEKWSGRRDSNPRPSPWQGDALPTEPLPLESPTTGYGGAESQNRTGDTAIFSRVLYQLSYLGPMANQALVTRRRPAGYHGPRRPLHDAGSGPGARNRLATSPRCVGRTLAAIPR